MIGKKKLVILILLKSAVFISAIVIKGLIEDGGITQFKVAPTLYILFNLVIFNSLFFLPLFLLKFKKREVLQRNLFRALVAANTLLLWYFTIADIRYLIALLLVDVLLFEISSLIARRGIEK